MCSYSYTLTRSFARVFTFAHGPESVIIATTSTIIEVFTPAFVCIVVETRKMSTTGTNYFWKLTLLRNGYSQAWNATIPCITEQRVVLFTADTITLLQSYICLYGHFQNNSTLFIKRGCKTEIFLKSCEIEQRRNCSVQINVRLSSLYSQYKLRLCLHALYHGTNQKSWSLSRGTDTTT